MTSSPEGLLVLTRRNGHPSQSSPGHVVLFGLVPSVIPSKGSYHSYRPSIFPLLDPKYPLFGNIPLFEGTRRVLVSLSSGLHRASCFLLTRAQALARGLSWQTDPTEADNLKETGRQNSIEVWGLGQPWKTVARLKLLVGL